MSLSLRPDPFLVPKEFKDWGTSLVVQWLRLRTSTAGGMGVILGQGAKILHAAREARPKKKVIRKIGMKLTGEGTTQRRTGKLHDFRTVLEAK